MSRLLRKINVIGTAGSGKSTFSRQLVKALNIPYIEMDRIFWKPQWQETEETEFLKKIEFEISQESWGSRWELLTNNRIKVGTS